MMFVQSMAPESPMQPIVMAPSARFRWANYPNIVARYEPLPSRLQTASACRFDGTNWLSVDEAAFTANGFTAGCMFRTSSATLQTLIFVGDKDAADEYQALRIDASQDLNATSVSNAAGAASATKAGSYADGAYHSAIMTVNSAGTSRKIYADSAAAVEETTTVTPGATYDRTTLGRTGDSTPTDYLIGDEDNAFIYRAEMTAAQVAWIVNSGSWRNWSDIATNTVGLVAATFSCWWELDEESGVRTNKAAGFGGNAIHLSPAGNAAGMTFSSATSEQARVDTAAATAVGFTMGCSVKTGTTAEQTAMWIGNKDTDDEFVRIGLSAAGDAILSRQASGGGEDVTTASNIDDDAWHTLYAVITAADDVDLYVDAAAAVNDVTSVAIANFDRTALGAQSGATPGAFMDGELDNAWVFAGVMTAAQLTWMRTGGITGGPATWQDIVLSSHADNPGVAGFTAFWQLNEATDAATLENVANPGTLDLTTVNTLTTATGHVTDLPTATDGTVTTTIGVQDRGLEFDGVDQNATAATVFRPSDTVGSIVAWLKTPTVAAPQFYFGISDTADGNSAFRVGVQITGIPHCLITEDGATVENLVGASDIDDGNWHLLIWKSTGSENLLSVDGSVFSDRGGSGGWISGVTDPDILVIGSRYRSVAGEFWDGMIDEVQYYDSALSDTDASELYNSGAGLLAQDLIDGSESLTSGKKPIHAWPLNSNHASGAGVDIGTTGGITLTLNNSPTDAPGIPEGQARGAGGVISQWTDSSSSGNDATQATWLNRPDLVSVSEGTGYAVRTDGIDDYLATAAWSALSQPNTIILVASVRDTNGNQTLCDGIAAGNEASLQVNATGDVVTVDAGTPDDSALTVDYGNVHIWTAVINGASTTLYKDGGTGEVLSVGAETQTGLTIGALFDGTLPADCDYYCMIVNDGALTDSKLNKIHQRLGSVYGVAVTNVA